MADLNELIEIGRDTFGLKAGNLMKWVQGEQSRRQEEIEKEVQREKEEAQRKKEELELEEQRKEKEEQRKEKDAQRKKEEFELEIARKKEEDELAEKEWSRKKAEYEMKNKMIDKEAELLVLKQDAPAPTVTSNSTTESSSTSSVSTKGPRLQPFDEEKDNIDNFLSRFERWAKTCNWDENVWSVHLSALLKGKSLDTYSRLSDDDAKSYDKVKTALLARYDLTEKGFSRRFRQSNVEPGEKVSQFVIRIKGYLEKWLKLAGKDKTNVEDVIDIFVGEQLTNICGPDLRMFLQERKPQNTDEIVKLAERFVDAHGVSYAFPVHKPNKHAKTSNTKVVSSGTDRVVNKPPEKKPVCFRCGSENHRIKDCRVKGPYGGPPFQKKWNDRDKRFPSKIASCEIHDSKEKSCGEEVSSNVSPCEIHDDNHEYLKLHCGCNVPVFSAVCQGEGPSTMPVSDGILNETVKVSVLRDSGCSTVCVKKGLVNDEELLKSKVTAVKFADGRIVKAPIVSVRLECPYFTGQVQAVALESPLYDVILGNIKGARCPGISLETEGISAVTTREGSRKVQKPLLTPFVEGTDISVERLKSLQKEDKCLERLHLLANKGETLRSGKENEYYFKYDKGVLTRYFKSPRIAHGDVVKQVVVPFSLREKVMKLAHESIMAGHLALGKTMGRILSSFYWPNINDDVAKFVKSCDVCQRSEPRGRIKKAPLTPMPLIRQPFSRIALDIIGPIIPASDRGFRYVLTAMDYSTRYPEAVCLKSIDTETVAESLVDIFTRVGIPDEILTDCGANFTSALMREVCRLMSVRHLTTTAYHPQTNGLVEKFNGTLKSMLKRLAAERPKDWDRYVGPALFAYREAPQDSLGFSPFELIYGRSVKGPMTLLRQLWTEDIETPEVKTTYQYVLDLNERLEHTLQLARESLEKASARYKKHFDKRTKPRSFKKDEKVLIFMPTKHNKMDLKWQGPFLVKDIVARNNYKIEIKGQIKTFHINMLKLYNEREAKTPSTTCGVLECAVAAIIPECEQDDELGSYLVDNVRMNTPVLEQSETTKDILISGDLSASQKKDLNDVFTQFQDVFTDVPGKTNVLEHEIRLTSTFPIRKKPYPVPQSIREAMREEVDKMIKHDLIEPSSSPYCSPSVVVKKKDGTYRYCIDFRAINGISIFDSEPIPRPDDLFQEIANQSMYLTKIDLSKGFWQIPMSEASKPLTAFSTEKGLYQFKVMPFGLQGAPATFSRLMRKVTNGLPNVVNYLDDCLLFTKTWEDHIKGLEGLLSRFRSAGLTARPSKCLVAFQEIEFLGHKIGKGSISPTIDKVEAIVNASLPETKKEMRSFLGLASFYRRYVPNFSALACSLTDATRKGEPNKIVWTDARTKAFANLKNALASQPVLRLPDWDKPFCLRTDASNQGIGAILMQEYEDGMFPVIYLSRKLLPSEMNYSTVEKECLSLVWSIKKLNTYLCGRQFTVETDHAPLLHLQKSKSENGRLMRWALLLNEYRFRLKSVPGKLNHGPDFLSRC